MSGSPTSRTPGRTGAGAGVRQRSNHNNNNNGNSQPGRSSRNHNDTRRNASRSNNNNNNSSRHRHKGSSNPSSDGTQLLRDEDVLIAFMPYLKDSHSEAARIHQAYQSGSDQRAFLQAARAFLERQRRTAPSVAPPAATPEPTPAPTTLPATSADATLFPHPPLLQPTPSAMDQSPSDVHTMLFGPTSVSQHSLFSPLHPTQTEYRPEALEARGLDEASRSQRLPPPVPTNRPNPPHTHHHLNNNNNNTLSMRSLEQGLHDLLNDEPVASLPVQGASIWGATPVDRIPHGPPPPVTPPRTDPLPSHAYPYNTVQSTATPWSSPSRTPIPPGLSPVFLAPTPSPAVPQIAADPPRQQTPKLTEVPPKTAKKEAPPPKRCWTYFHEQPGRLNVDGTSGEDSSVVLPLAPRSELTAHWTLPLTYLRQYALEHLGPRVGLEKVLAGLSVGLFRRGCTENGSQASIISKCVLGENNRTYKFWRDAASESVHGKVPFYSPRTPGHVILRMYWDKNPLYTLAMGPTLLVRVTENEFDGSVRFILSNFKAKKSNPTSLSSLHSLASVLETPLSRPNESAARATWGCVQEARKVLDACAAEYAKTSAKLSTLEETVDELKKRVEAEETSSPSDRSLTDGESRDGADPQLDSDLTLDLREKTKTLMGGRASCERKWRDSQLAFASILRAVVSNSTLSVLLRRDLITKMRIEYELWCPLSEEFAIPSDTAKMWYEPLKDLPHTITADDFRFYAQVRTKMQMRTLGFDPNLVSLEDILFPPSRGKTKQRVMDAGAVGVFNNVSAAMGQYFQNLYMDEDRIVRQRQMIQERTQHCVEECAAFPLGTKVVIFGSSANGFGSPKSDLDMCLQLPEGSRLNHEAGGEAMAKLAQYLDTFGMKSVDTARLTARIPIVMFQCPNPMSTGNGEDDLIECDLSMHNTLAVLNTALLRTYAEITPVTRVLAAIIKRWAKARDINNPARHTLSSYGYIIMLLHFLSYHKRNGNGLVSAVAPPEGNASSRKESDPSSTPLLPNLQWMDPAWPNFPKGTPYKELRSLPKDIKEHPLEEKKTINAYFYKPSTPNDKALLQMLFPGQDLSLAILLASFFRYYAYEFDYKRQVVSLHSTATRGVLEREVKAELDGWRNYSAALTIEDPFETFYDVAHVLRGGYYHRIRREFTVAYSKIADASAGRTGNWNKGDLRSMSGEELIDWICEPVSSESNDTNAP